MRFHGYARRWTVLDIAVRFGRFRVSVRDLVQEVERPTSNLAALAEKVEFRADGEPLRKGTQVEVYRIAALLDDGASVGQVLEDYPSLSREHVETAKAYAEASPKAGRPYLRVCERRYEPDQNPCRRRVLQQGTDGPWQRGRHHRPRVHAHLCRHADSYEFFVHAAFG